MRILFATPNDVIISLVSLFSGDVTLCGGNADKSSAGQLGLSPGNVQEVLASAAHLQVKQIAPQYSLLPRYSGHKSSDPDVIVIL